MILVGDIGYWHNIKDICIHVRDLLNCDVIFIPGNHEYYCYHNPKYTINELNEYWRMQFQNQPGIHILLDEHMDFKNISIFGSTWWSCLGKVELCNRVPDYWTGSPDFQAVYVPDKKEGIRLISTYEMRQLNQQAKEAYNRWYMGSQGKLRILCSHFPMLEPLRHPLFPPNPYFVSDDEEWLLDRKPDILFFGHTHYNMQLEYKGIRCYSNMGGYPKENVGTPFDPTFSLAISTNIPSLE